MRKLLAAAAVSCLVGLAQADDGTAAAGAAVDPAHAHTAQPAGAASDAGAKAAKKPAAPRKRATSRAAPKGAAAEKPCEPVKPCPIE